MLYMNTNTLAVVTERPKDSYEYESFTPTRKWSAGQRGYVVAVFWTTYNSFGPEEGISVEVIDLYKTREEAETAAKIIHKDAVSRSMDSSNFPKIPLANGEGFTDRQGPYKFLPWIGWGNTFEKVVISQITIGDAPIKNEWGKYDEPEEG